MSVGQISGRYSTALTLLQQVGQNQSTKAASDTTNNIIKTAQGISAAPGAAAKQASGAAFDFTVDQSLKDEANTADASGSIIMAGIGGGEAVERFDSWEALETRIRTDQKMDGKQKSYWLDQASALKQAVIETVAFQKSDTFLSLKSGSFKDNAVQAYLSDSKSVSGIRSSLKDAPINIFSRGSNA
ncbi:MULTISPECIES: hypothetical protein [Methylobacterium]|uniref:hypothetical protein n=1 Tax=Methylobacterium TaxID=407 RepID=UPI0013ECE184|nr:hypothetical protein [Methylobacterium sp. DB0501]NGM39047.1 hypothetical protein [Methylobacterium sp. DB0501]